VLILVLLINPNLRKMKNFRYFLAIIKNKTLWVFLYSNEHFIHFLFICLLDDDWNSNNKGIL